VSGSPDNLLLILKNNSSITERFNIWRQTQVLVAILLVTFCYLVECVSPSTLAKNISHFFAELESKSEALEEEPDKLVIVEMIFTVMNIDKLFNQL